MIDEGDGRRAEQTAVAIVLHQMRGQREEWEAVVGSVSDPTFLVRGFLRLTYGIAEAASEESAASTAEVIAHVGQSLPTSHQLAVRLAAAFAEGGETFHEMMAERPLTGLDVLPGLARLTQALLSEAVRVLGEPTGGDPSRPPEERLLQTHAYRLGEDSA